MKIGSHSLIRYLPRKHLALLLLLGITGSLIWTLWERQEDKPQERPIHISIAIPAGSPMRTMVVEGIVKEFMQAYPDVQVDIQDIPGSKYYQKMLVMLASRTGPDILWMGQSFSEFADRGVFLDLTPYIAGDKDLRLQDYNQQSLSWYRYGEAQYAIPFGIDMRIMVYNQDLFDKAGIKYPSDEWTFEDFLKTCQSLTADKNRDGPLDRYGYQGLLEICLFDAQAFSRDGSQAVCNSPQMLDYLQTNLDLFQKYHISPTPREQMQQTGLDRFSIFRQNKIAIMVMATWDFPEMKKQFANMRWNLVLNPKVKRRGQWVSSQAFTIWRDTKHADICWKLYRALSGPKLQQRLAFQAIPTHRATLNQTIKEYRGQPDNLAALQKAMDRLYPTPRVPHLQELTALFTNACQSVWTGRDTPHNAMKKAEHQINQAIAKRKN